MSERHLNTLRSISNEDRLNAFRLLVKSGHNGVAAGEIGKELCIKSSTMSSHLKVLRHANLVRVNREGRIIRYFANMDEMNSLVSFLYENCCTGVEPKDHEDQETLEFSV
ncbi:MAG: helix-turn-helix domain-containing protein [Pseudomonadota bacterium]